MPELSTLEYVAELAILRVLAEHASQPPEGDGIGEALERAYPFGDHPKGREVWQAAVARHVPAALQKKPTDTSGASGSSSGCASTGI